MLSVEIGETKQFIASFAMEGILHGYDAARHHKRIQNWIAWMLLKGGCPPPQAFKTIQPWSTLQAIHLWCTFGHPKLRRRGAYNNRIIFFFEVWNTVWGDLTSKQQTPLVACAAQVVWCLSLRERICYQAIYFSVVFTGWRTTVLSRSGAQRRGSER